MNGESDIQALHRAVIDALTELSVEVKGIAFNFRESLTRAGAQDVLDRLAARGFKVVRE